MQNCLISIAMATYNGENFICEQLDSIINQSYENIEIIICDDCSTDSTQSILKEYAAKDTRIKVTFNENNLGFIKNFEKAVNLCSGEYIALADQDDIWMPHKIETLLTHIGKHSLACSDASLIDSKGKIFAKSFITYSNNKPDLSNRTDIFVRLLFSNFVTGCTTLIKKEVITKAHPIPQGIPYHDWWYGLIAASLNGIYFHNDQLIHYRQHSDNHTGAVKGLKFTKQFHLLANKDYFLKRQAYAKSIQERLHIYLNSKKFNSDQVGKIYEILSYFENRQKGIIHLKAFVLAIKYRHEIYLNTPLFLKWIKCFRSLFL